MRYIIGIIVGILIVLNWGTVKSAFDTSLQKQAQETSPAKAAAEPAKAPEPIDLNGAVEGRLKDIAAGK